MKKSELHQAQRATALKPGLSWRIIRKLSGESLRSAFYRIFNTHIGALISA
jgi:hypothetical protein